MCSTCTAGTFSISATGPSRSFFSTSLASTFIRPVGKEAGQVRQNNLRFFLRNSPAPTVVRTLKALWDCREAERRRQGADETIPAAEEQFYDLIERLGGTRPRPKRQAPSAADDINLDPRTSAALKVDLMSLSQLEPQARRFAFERFLKALFDANGMSGRSSFRLVGEQIAVALSSPAILTYWRRSGPRQRLGLPT